MTTQNALFNRQYALIAKRAGDKCNFYRPASATNPLQTAYLQQYASFNQDYRYGKPNKYGVSTWYGMFDSSSCQVGDIIDGVDGTFFIAALQSCLPILLVQCNRTVSVLRVSQSGSKGAVGYGGDTKATETL